MDTETLLADSRLAFVNGQFGKSLELARKAIESAPDNADCYHAAAAACMSLDNCELAADYYMKAVKYDSKNGNRYFNFGYALCAANKTADALKALAKADELGCSQENTAQLYHLLGIICFDIGKYDDSLVNLKKAEQIMGADAELLERMAVIYGLKEDLANGIFTSNQMKLIAPSEYGGYKTAFRFLCQAKRYKEALFELKKAAKYAKPNADYYFDYMSYELEMYGSTKDNSYLEKAVSHLADMLEEFQPSVQQVLETYINAAEIYMQLEQADKAVNCLNAAMSPVSSFNMGFDILQKEYQTEKLTEYDVEDMLEQDRNELLENYGVEGLEELAAQVEPDEDGNRDYFTVLEKAEEEEKVIYKLDEAEEPEYTTEINDQISRLYVGAYTLLGDFEKVMAYAGKLKASSDLYSEYMGRYAYVSAMKSAGLENADEEYEKLVVFFRNALLKDPTDAAAVTYRIQCLMDMKRFDEAEEVCDLLSGDMKKGILEEIRSKKAGGNE